MEAGRELDALISERVFGVKAFSKEYAEISEYMRGGSLWLLDAEGHPLLPRYSADMNAAWEVWGKMKKANWIQFYDALREIAAPPGTAAYDWLYALDAKLICLAALQAIEPAQKL